MENSNNLWKINDMSNIPIKKSFGIILCKINHLTNKPEVLLVHKRYTYAYSMFVHGKYVKPNIWPKNSNNFIMKLLTQMTIDELLDIWSLDFRQMWYRIWIGKGDDEFYKRKYTKFYLSFIKSDKGEKLRKIIQQIRNYSMLGYECPKGRPINSNETNIECAIREVYEETGYKKNNYTILPNVRRYVNYISTGTRYILTYYIAIINPNSKYSNFTIFKDISNINEVSETKWFDIDKIRVIDDYKHHLESLIAPAFKLVKKYLNGNWITRYREIKT